MASIDPTTLTPDRLAPMLRAWTCGLPPGEAAVELLIAHRYWLRRADFRRELIDAIDDGWGPGGSVVPMASVNWDGVERFADAAATTASTTEITILRLAASLAGTTINTSLLDLTRGLDHVNASLLLDAIAHRLGWHRHHHTHLVTGHPTQPFHGRCAAAGRRRDGAAPLAGQPSPQAAAR